MTEYVPHPKQVLFHRSPGNELLYGGAAGPGKSHALRHEGFTWCMRIPGLHVYLFRRTHPDLEKNHILPSLNEFPSRLGTYKSHNKRWEFRNGSMLHFCHCQYEKDVFHYQGAEIHLLLIDELTTFTEFMYDYLRGRVRCALEIPEKYKHKIPGIATGSNPGGEGHEFVKSRWVDPDPLKEMKLLRAPDKEGGMLRQYIPGKLEDNPSLTLNDPTYINRLDALPEPYRSAYKNGDWDIFLGQAFHLSKEHHIIPPLAIPGNSPIYMTFDWGYGAPFSVGWWWVDSDGRIYRFAEWYGWNKTPNQGLRITDSEIAETINKKEDALKIKGREPMIRLAGQDCFQKKPDYRGGGQGPSTTDVFADHGLILTEGDPSRAAKIKQFHERLRIIRDEKGMVIQVPMMQVYDTCKQFIRTIPLLQNDAHNVEDIDTTGEDHPYDEACHICMARPILPELPIKKYSRGERTMAHVKGKIGDPDELLPDPDPDDGNIVYPQLAEEGGEEESVFEIEDEY